MFLLSCAQIINKEEGFLNDNSSSGKTLAFEIGSQSMICPIIVEDLNEPRQMRVVVNSSPFQFSLYYVLNSNIVFCDRYFVRNEVSFFR